jgi:hypothetical protein
VATRSAVGRQERRHDREAGRPPPGHGSPDRLTLSRIGSNQLWIGVHDTSGSGKTIWLQLPDDVSPPSRHRQMCSH